MENCKESQKDKLSKAPNHEQRIAKGQAEQC